MIEFTYTNDQPTNVGIYDNLQIKLVFYYDFNNMPIIQLQKDCATI